MLSKMQRTMNAKRLAMLSSRDFSYNTHYFKVLREEALSDRVKDCQYAVRGAIPLQGEQIKMRIKGGDTSFPF